jgi:hypothetical protein
MVPAMEPTERTFLAEDPAYQAKAYGAHADDDLSVFVHASVLEQVLAEAGAHKDAQRAGGLIGTVHRAGARRFVEIAAASLLDSPRNPASQFALEPSELDALRLAQERLVPGGEVLGVYVTHPSLGLYLSRSEAAFTRKTFDPSWCVNLVIDPATDKFTFFRFKDDAPAKSPFWTVVRLRVETVLTREELFRLATEEVFKDGQVDDEENRTLQALGGLLRIDRDTAIKLAKAARKKFKAGELTGKGALDSASLYKRAAAFAMQDGELEQDEVHILAALRFLLKIDDRRIEKPTPPPPPPPPAADTPFRQLLADQAGVAFERQVHALERLGDHDFSWDLEAGTITLGGGTYTMQALGIVNEDQQSWIWGWAAQHLTQPLPEHILADAHRLQAMGSGKGIPELARPVSKLADVSADELAMVGSGLCNAYLYYRLPYPGGALYVLVTDPAFGRSPMAPAARIPLLFPRLLESIPVAPRRALAAYLRACGLELSEGAAVVVGKAKDGERVIATFDEVGRLVEIKAAPPA